MKLRHWLKKTKITVTDFASLMKLNRTYIHMWMSGRKKPSAHVMERIRDISMGQIQEYEDLLEERNGK